MADKRFYLSELAFEMLIASQGEKAAIPTSDVLSKTDSEALHSELYSLVTNNIIINNTEAERFDINDELIPIFKSIFSAKALLRVSECLTSDNPIYYYLAPCGIAEMKNNIFRKCVGLSFLNAGEMLDSIQDNLNLYAEYRNVSKDTDMFINAVDERIAGNDDVICSDMLNKSIDEIKNQIKDTVGVLDLILSDDLSVRSRIVIFKRSIYYKVAQISDAKVTVNNYSRINFERIIETMTGEFL